MLSSQDNGQGTVADRTKEHLGQSDGGILMVRKRFLDDLETVAAGGDPKAVIRDPEINKCVALPIAERKALIEGLPWDEMIEHPFLGRELVDGYPFQAGQPDDIRRLFEDAMGITAHRSRIFASNSAASSP